MLRQEQRTKDETGFLHGSSAASTPRYFFEIPIGRNRTFRSDTNYKVRSESRRSDGDFSNPSDYGRALIREDKSRGEK